MELLERVVELSLEGYCCSQVMALLLLELLGEEDDGFVRAMGGLINGGGKGFKVLSFCDLLQFCFRKIFQWSFLAFPVYETYADRPDGPTTFFCFCHGRFLPKMV